MLQDGVTHEHDVVDRLFSKGIKVLHSYRDGQVEVKCSENPLIVGHPDGILDVPERFGEFALDYADEGFKPARFLLLEVTAPNHFTFLRLKRSHLRAEIPRKYAQIQMYLNSEGVRSFGNCCVCVVKNKNTSELYEEGISLDRAYVGDIVEKLKRVEDLASRGAVSEYRCEDWHRSYCRFKWLCFGEQEEVSLPGIDVLDAKSLGEYAMLKEVADAWKRGKLLKLEGEDLIADSRAQFEETIRQYGCRGILVEDVRASMVEAGINRRVDYDSLRIKHPDVYDEVVSESVRESYVRVSD
jgi:hypothetical protein